MTNSKKHNKKISVDLRGFHIFDDGESSSEDEGDNAEVAKKKAQRKALKDRIKHAKKMSVDLGGYHLFDDGESSDEEENDGGMSGPKKSGTTKKMHNKKISVDLRGFDLFEDSDSEEESDDDESDGPGKVTVGTSGKAIGDAANAEFKKAQRVYLSKETEEDDDLKGFHLFDEYNDDDSEDDVVKLHEMEQGQLAALVRSLLVENAILKDAAARARAKLDSRKNTIKSLENNKRNLVKAMAMEMDSMRDIIRTLGSGASSTRRKTVS